MAAIQYDAEGVVFDIQRYSIHDGPGIRTIVFLKGCPLTCRWCSNPESQDVGISVLYQSSACVHCGQCVEACPQAAISPQNPAFIDRTKCLACGTCLEVCPSGALTMKGARMTVSEVIQELRKDATCYRRSGGGITLSGGEPLLQADYAAELLAACKEKGWTTAVETAGYVSKRVISRIMPLVDLALFDIKTVDPESHRTNTGVPNKPILENALYISQLTQVRVRVPLVRGVNATPEAIGAIIRFTRQLRGVERIDLLPYHTYGENKYALLGRDYPMGATTRLTAEEVAPLAELVTQAGFVCVIGG